MSIDATATDISELIKALADNNVNYSKNIW